MDLKWKWILTYLILLLSKLFFTAFCYKWCNHGHSAITSLFMRWDLYTIDSREGDFWTKGHAHIKFWRYCQILHIPIRFSAMPVQWWSYPLDMMTVSIFLNMKDNSIYLVAILSCKFWVPCEVVHLFEGLLSIYMSLTLGLRLFFLFWWSQPYFKILFSWWMVHLLS